MIFLKTLVLLLLIICFVVGQQSAVSALSASQQQLFQEGVNYFDICSSDNGGCCTTSDSTTSVTLTGNDNEQKIFNYFVSQGLSPIQSAGIDGNFGQESHWNPYEPGGYLAQWSSTRLASLSQLAQKEGKPITDLGVQLDFVWQELNSDYKNVLTNLKNSTGIADAVNQFMGPNNLSGSPISVTDPSQRSGGYEDPGIPMGQNRLAFANSALELYGAGVAAEGGSITSSNGCTVSVNSGTNCDSVSGSPKILCEAKQYNGIYYEFGGGHQGYKAFITGCPDPSNPPNNLPTGGPVNGDPAGASGNPSPCATDCSGLVSVAVDEAFGQNYIWTVQNYTMQGDGSSYWHKIPLSQVKAGDIVTQDEHVEIVDHADGNILYTFGSHYTTSKTSEIPSTLSSWGAAYTWAGPESGI